MGKIDQPCFSQWAGRFMVPRPKSNSARDQWESDGHGAGIWGFISNAMQKEKRDEKSHHKIHDGGGFVLKAVIKGTVGTRVWNRSFSISYRLWSICRRRRLESRAAGKIISYSQRWVCFCRIEPCARWLRQAMVSSEHTMRRDPPYHKIASSLWKSMAKGRR